MLCHLFYLLQRRIIQVHGKFCQDRMLYLLNFLLCAVIYDEEKILTMRGYNISVFRTHCTRLI